MLPEVVAAGRGHGVELVVGQGAPEVAARGAAGAEETVVGVLHAVVLEYGAHAPLVEGAVVRHERQTLHHRRDLGPHLGEMGRGVGVGTRESVYGGVPTRVVVGIGPDEAVFAADDLPVAHDDHTHAADAGAGIVRRLEVYGRKISHSDTKYKYISNRENTIRNVFIYL